MGISATNPRGIQTTDGSGNFIGWHVKSDGNVGIGTTSPTEKLHINYTNNELKVSDGNIIYGREENISRQSLLSTAETYYGSREHSIIRNANSNYRNTGDNGARYDTHKIVLGYSETYDYGDNGYYPTYNAIKFQTVTDWSTTTLNTNMIILSNGNVGIGTTDPQNRLDIVQDNARTGNHRTGAAIYATSSSGDKFNGTIEVRHYNGTQGIGIGYNSLYATGDNTDQNINIIPRGSGNVGIDTVSPTSKLHVNGNINVNGKINLSEISTPSQPSDGNGVLYTKAGGLPYWRSYDINETALIENGRQFSFYATSTSTGHFLSGYFSEGYYQYTNTQTFTIGLVENSSQFFDLNNVEYTVPMDGNYTFGWTTGKLGHSNGSRLIIRRFRNNGYTNLVDSGYSNTSAARHTTYTGDLQRNDRITWWVYGTGGTYGGYETGLYISPAVYISTSATTLVYGYKN